MPNTRRIQPSRQQEMRRFAGEYASATSQTPLSYDELKEMQSYRDYLNEVYSQEAAIRRAERQREYEESLNYEEQKEKAFLHDISRYGAQYGVRTDSENRPSLPKMTESQKRDEVIKQLSERKDYMPDAVFENIINKQTEPDFKPVHKTPSDLAYYMHGQRVDNPIGAWIYNTIADLTYNNYKAAKQKEERQETNREFYNYTSDAQKAAFERYKQRHGITDKDVQQNGRKVINKQNISDADLVYNYLTSPEGIASNIQDRIQQIQFDPKRNPEYRFGSPGYFKDATIQYAINLNEAQMRSFSGRIDRTSEVVSRGQDAIQYYKNLEEIESIEKQLNVIQTTGQNSDKYQDLLLRKLELEDDNRMLYKNKELFEQYVPSDPVDKALLFSVGLLSKLENKVFGSHLYDWTTPIFDDADILRENLKGFNNAKTAEEKQQYLNNYINARDKKIKSWQEGIAVNQKDKDSYENGHKISDYFKYWEQNANGNILNGDTWAYKQPGLMGYSNSGWIKQLPMYIGAIVAPQMGTKGVAASATTGFIGAHSAAQDENYMEVRENFVPVIKREIKNLGEDVYDTFIADGYNYVDKKLVKNGSDDEVEREIINAYLDGRYRPRVNVQAIYEATANAAHGLNALFDRDMLAVDIDNAVNTAILFGNYAKLGKLTKFLAPAENKISPLVGYSSALFKLSPAGKKVYKMVDDATTFMTTVPERIYTKAKKLAPEAIKTPSTKLKIKQLEKAISLTNNPSTKLALKTYLNNLKQFAAITIGSGISEGIEEGKQWLGGQAFRRGEFDDSKVSFGWGIDVDKWYDDMTNGIYSAYVIAGIPLGLEYTHDAELVENIKGGIMGGLFQTGATTFTRSLMQTPQMMRLNKYMLNNVMAEKAARTDLYNKAKLYAQKSFSDQDVDYIRRRFDDLIKMNKDAKEKGGEWVLDDGIIEEQKALFETVHKLARSKDVQDRAEKLGFAPGDDKYNQFIAHITLQQQLFDEVSENKNNIIQQIIKEEQLLEPIYSVNPQTNRIMRKTGTMLLPFTGELIKRPDGTVETNEEAVDRLNSNHAQSAINALRAKVIRSLIDQLNVSGTELFGNSKSSKNFLEHRLKKQLDNVLSHFKPEYRDQNKLNTLIESIQNSKRLEDLYRKLALLQVDQDYASMMYQGLMGKYSIHESQQQEQNSPNGVKLDYLYDDPDYTTTFNNIIKAFETRIEGDNALYDALEQDYIERSEKLEKDRNDEARKIFLQQHPEIVEQEKSENEQRVEPQSYITATDKSTKQQITYETANEIAKSIKNKKAQKNKDIKNIFKGRGINIDQKYNDVVYDAARQLVKGQISEHQFANLFVPQEQRQQAPVVQQQEPATQQQVQQPQKKQYTAPTIQNKPKPQPQKKQYVAPSIRNEEKPQPQKQQVENKQHIHNTEDLNRFEELKKKFGSINKNIPDNYGEGNNDGEIMSIVSEMMFLLIKNGNKDFYTCGKIILENLGEISRQYLKSAYEGARFWPGTEQYADGMTSQDEVRKININSFDKQSELDIIHEALINYNIDVNRIINQDVAKYSGYESSAPSVVNLKQKFEELKQLVSTLARHFEEKNIQEANDTINELKRQISNYYTIQDTVEKELATFEENRRQLEVQRSEQDQYKQWVKSALESLSFYAVKIANNQQLSEEDIKNLNVWINIIGKEVQKLQSDQNNQQYIDLLNYYEYFVGIGIDGSDAPVLNIIDTSEASSAPRWEILNTVHTKSLSQSKALDDDSIYLKQFTSDKDFITNAEFEFVLGGSKTFDGDVATGAPKKIYVIVKYKGHTFEPVAVWDTTSEEAEEENKGFGDAVRSLIENNPGKKVIPVVVKRSKGTAFKQPNGEKVSLIDAGLVDDVYTISFDNDQDQFMLTRELPVAGGKVLIRATKPNKTGRGVSAVYTYSKDSTVQTAGNVVYMMRIEGSDKPLLPINVYSDTMSEGDAQLVVDILTGKYTNGIIGKQAMSMPFILNGEYLGINDGGQTIGLTAENVLNLILPYGPFGRKGNDIVHVWHSQFGDSKIMLSGKFKGDDKFTNHEFNLSTTQGKELFKKFLMENVRKNISERIMKSSFGKPTEHKDNPILGLANFVFSRQGTDLRKRLQNGEEIRLGNSSIVFDWNDLGNDKRNGGITGIGWYVKRGFLKTDFAGINNALINFSGAMLEEDNTQKPKAEKPVVSVASEKPIVIEEQQIQQKPGARRKVGRSRKNLEKRTTEVGDEELTVDDVRSILSEILPSSEDALKVEISEDYLDDEQVSRVCAVSAAAPHVVGRCYADGIELYKRAKRGVIYHEAFHRISEIFLDDEERKRVYNRFEKVYRLTHFGKKPSIDEIREGTADQFMMFMETNTTSLGTASNNIFKRLWNTIKFIARIGSYGQYKLYSQIAAGRFKHFKFDDAAKKRAENFAANNPDGFGFTIEGQNFKYILNEHAFKELVNSLVYFAFHANNIAYDGSNINELVVDKDTIEKSEMYIDYTQDDSLGSSALKEAMEHFDIFAPYVVSAISEFATDYKVVMEEQNAEEAQSEDVSAASIFEHTHQSYEFSQFSRASSKVRFFFSRIDDLTTAEVDGSTEYVDRLNGLGLPQFMSAKAIFNDVLNQLWDIDDLNDMMNRIAILSKDSPVYQQLYNRLNKIKNNAYKNNYNVDEEALLVQIYNVIKSNKQQFLLSQASKYYVGKDFVGYTVNLQNTDQEYNARNYRFEWSNLFAHGGSIFVETGEDGRLRTKKGMPANSMSKYWGQIVNQDPSQKLGIAAAFSSDEQIRRKFTMALRVNGQVVQKQINAKDNRQDLDLCKIKFIQILNCFGIQFNKEMLDYMLRQKYGNSGFEGMQQMFEETGVASLHAVTFYMNGTYFDDKGKLELNLDEEGRINGRLPEQIFAYSKNNDEGDSNGFFGELAKYKYLYRHAHDQLSVLAAAGNKYYVISENNYITDTVHYLNRAAAFYRSNASQLSSGIEEFDDLCNFSYNLIEDQDEYIKPLGSIILKQILGGLVKNLDVCIFSGMKSDFRGDKGVDYATISRRDDYISKLAILLNGGLVFPTMSDKKTWTFIKGFVLPGINWAKTITGADILGFVAHDKVTGQSIVDNHGRIKTSSLFSYALQNNNDVVDQLIEYFITEHEQVRQTLEDMKTLPKERRVANYHGGANVKDVHGEQHTVIQGARHSSLLNLYDDNDEIIHLSKLLDEKGEYIDEQKEYDLLEETFFQPRENETGEDLLKRQRIHVNRILKHRLEEELKKLEQMGLVKHVGQGNTIFDYDNIGIDAQKVEQVYKVILEKYGVREAPYIVKDVDGSSKQVYDLSENDIKRFKALALATVVNDGMVKAIISKNETERIFSGHPSFFKWGYDKNGNLVDRGVDQHKRYGGLVSTGQNAALWARGVHAKYRSAEIDNEMVQSGQIDFLEKTIYEGSLRSTLINYYLDKNGYSVDNDEAKDIVSDVDAMDLDKVKQALLDAGKESYPNNKQKWSIYLDLAETQAKEKTNDFRKDKDNKGIDVADGAAYVTDEFFEQMLRSIGAFDSKIERAFKILRGEEVDGKVYTIKDITTIAEATEAVYTAVIGTQKYTAYGQRMQTGWDAEDGHHEGTTLIPYYDKFALFPLFKIICTGKMAHIYNAMKNQKVDMLKIKSAIKVGMEGSQPIDWSQWTDQNGNITESFYDEKTGFKFNVYQQRMKYLRKQFNTDPKEKEFLTMGTQMTKVVMQALTPGRSYTTQDGRTLTARQLRDDVMKSMNEIARLGNEKFRKEFFNSDGTMNLHAFAKMIKDELSRRGASKDVIDGFSIIKQDGKEVFKISPSAQSDISWIQSILVSATNKRIIDINTPGNLFIQRSIWGMEGPTKVLGDDNLPISINRGKKLKLINEEGSMDCVLSIDFFEHIIPKVPLKVNGKVVYKTGADGQPVYKHNEDGTIKFGENGLPVREVEMRKMSFREAKQWLIDNDIISGVRSWETEWHNANSNIVGYRIPTQAISSIHAFRCVDVLPVVRDTVIMPEEITKVTGSDFDVDKMFLSMLNYKVTKGKARDYDFLSSESEYHENRLLKDYIAMLLNKDENGIPRNVQQLHGSIDKDTKLLTDTLDELESEGAFKERMTYEDYVLSNEVFIKQDFITGKNGIGPFALNNNNHILTMLYGVRFRKDKKSILTRLNLNRLDRTVDRDGKSILSWLSGLINAHVDIAKDPYIGRLGVNPFTYNMTNLLIRTGLGKYTFYFLTQPIIMRLAEVYTNAAGVYGVDRTKTVSQLRRESKENYIVQYINSNLNTNFDTYEYKDAIAAWEKTMRDRNININQAIDYLFNSDVNILKDVSKSYKSSSEDNQNITIDTKFGHQVISMFDLQMLVFTAFEQFDPYAQALSSVVKYSKIDTKKQGKNITEQRAYRQGVYNTFVNIRGLRRMFNGNLYKMYNESYIKQKTDLALSAFEDLLSEQIIQATPQFERQLNIMFDVLNKYGDRLTDDLISEITEAIIQWIKSKFINEYAKRNNIDIKGLVSGDNTIFDRLVKLQIAIKTKPEYSDLTVDGEINNYLLRSLVTALQQTIRQEQITENRGQEDTYKNAKFIKLLNFLEDDQIDSDQIRSDWDQLLNDGTHPELQDFARDLVVYSFITTGDVGGGMRNLFKFVPNSWKLSKDGGNESYNDYMRRVLNEYNNNTAPALDIEDIILNNWKNYNFVPTFNISIKNGFRFQTYYPEGFDYPIIISGLTNTENGDVYPTFNDDPDSEQFRPSPKYLKIRRANEDIDESSQRVFNIYKRISFGIYAGKDGVTYQYPIYVLVGPKGNTFNGNYKILEYGRQDQEYKELVNAVTKDRLISALLMGMNKKYTDIESLLDTLSSGIASVDLILTAYNQIAGTNLQMDETLKQLLIAYRDRQQMIDVGGKVLHMEYSRATVQSDPQNLYIFTDNTDRTSGTFPIDDNSWYAAIYSKGKQLFYPSKTTAQIRGLENAYPISTQRYFNDEKRGVTGRWEDADYDIVVDIVEKELLRIQQAWFSGMYKNIVLPVGDGFVNASISQITQENSPKLYKYFTEVEQRIINMVENNQPMVEEEPRTFIPGTHPQEQLLKYAFDNTYDLLQYISDNSENKYYSDFVKKLAEYAKNHSVKINYRNHGADGNYVAQYHPSTDDIWVNLDKQIIHERADEILIHETVHSLTSAWLNEHQEDAESIMMLAEYVKSKIDELNISFPEGADSWFKNAKEFITYATTNPEFRSVLQKIEPMDSKKYESIFEQLLDKIKEIIYKIAQTENPSVIKQIDPIVDRILNLQSEMQRNDSYSPIDNHMDIYGNNYGWSVESIGNHLKTLINDIKGSYKQGIKSASLYNYMVNHVADVNSKYGTNFQVYKERTTGIVKIKWNTNPQDMLNLTDNPNSPKQLELFDNLSELRKLGQDLMRQCGY